MPIDVTLPYNGLALDRAAASRSNPDWVAAIRSRAGSSAVVFWRDRCLVAADQPVLVPPTDDAVFLGLDGEFGKCAGVADLWRGRPPHDDQGRARNEPLPAGIVERPPTQTDHPHRPATHRAR